MNLLQVVDGVRAIQETMPSSWIDEPHEKLLWGIVMSIAAYLGKQQLFDRRKYRKDLKDAVNGMSNPHPDPRLNGRTNSAELLKYVIEDVREMRKEVQLLSIKHESLSVRVHQLGLRDSSDRG